MAKEFTVRIDDQPGTLAELTETLAKHAINIVAMHATACPERGIVQFVTDNTDATVNALGSIDMEYDSTDVLIFNLPHQPGVLAQLARALGEKLININALYMSMEGSIVMAVSDIDQTQKIAMGLGIR